MQIQSSADRIVTLLSLAHQRKNKQTKITPYKHKSHPIRSLPNHWTKLQFTVQFSRSVVSDPWRPHESQHARPPCPSPTPGVHSNSCPSSWWCHPTISFSVVPFCCPQSCPASGSFKMSQLSASGGQSIGVSASSVLPVNTQDWENFGLSLALLFQVLLKTNPINCIFKLSILKPDQGMASGN